MSEQRSVEDKLREWVTTQGYPLEMRVASQFRKHANFEIRQGWHYTDAETSTSREIDIVCTRSEIIGLAAVHFAISCKAGTKPWVLVISPFTLENYNRLLRFGIATRDARRAISDAVLMKTDATGAPVHPPLTWFWDDGPTAYTLVQAFGEKTDIPYSATLSAVKAALYCCLSSPQHPSAPRYSLSFPVVVTSAPLFSCSIDEAGETHLSEIDMGFLFFQQKIGDLPSMRVAVVSEKGLPAFIEQCNTVSLELHGILAPVVEKEWKEIQARLPGAADSVSL